MIFGRTAIILVFMVASAAFFLLRGVFVHHPLELNEFCLMLGAVITQCLGELVTVRTIGFEDLRHALEHGEHLVVSWSCSARELKIGLWSRSRCSLRGLAGLWSSFGLDLRCFLAFASAFGASALVALASFLPVAAAVFVSLPLASVAF